MNLRKYILATTTIILGGVLFVLYRGQILVSRTYTVKRINTRAESMVTIVALADLHGNRFGQSQESLVQKVNKAKPDLIVYVGDMVERTRVDESIDSLVSLTTGLSKIAPICYVDGNHEIDVLKSNPEKYTYLNKKLKELGAVQLNNSTACYNVKDVRVNICGISTHYWKGQEKQLAATLRSKNGVNILLCHYPESVLSYGAYGDGGIDVAICGHTHGGLIQVPFMGGLFAPEWGLWPKYDFGAYPIYSNTNCYGYGGGDGARFLGMMIVSGGLAGEHGIPRVNNPCEVSVIEIK